MEKMVGFLQSVMAMRCDRELRYVLALLSVVIGLAISSQAQSPRVMDKAAPASLAPHSPAVQSQAERRGVMATIAGFVRTADGAPVQGAVLVSAHGGETVTCADGSFTLETPAPGHASSIGLTAVASINGANHFGNTLAPINDRDGRGYAGTIVLSAGDECEPAWIPSFGGRPGVNDWVEALTVFDDGSGPALYAGGLFTQAGGVEASRIAKWDGARWTPLASEIDGDVLALTVFDDGSGPALIVGGAFASVGDLSVNSIAKWDGAEWSPLGIGVNSVIHTLTVFDDGSGPALYAGGAFFSAGGVSANRIAMWDGAAWSALGSGINSTVRTMTVFDDGTGPALYAGGSFTSAGSVKVNSIAKWDGVAWSPLGSGLSSSVFALTVFDDGTGPALYAGGSFTTAGGVEVNSIAKWDGDSWSPLGSGMTGMSGELPRVDTLIGFDDGMGPALYAGGWFATAGGVTAKGIAKWDGAAWSPLGSGVSGAAERVKVLTTIDESLYGSPALYVGGAFINTDGVEVRHIARWDGDVWSALGTGISSGVAALTVFDDGTGPALYAGGMFATVGGVKVNSIAKWDGVSWSPLGSGMGGVSSPRVNTLTVFDDGSGPALYAGGRFTNAGGVNALRIAKWNGAAWSPVGSGVSGGISEVQTLAVFDDGSGPALYVGGSFTTAGGVTVNRIAKWDGAVWSALGSGMNSDVLALTGFDDGSGPALYAGGLFFTAGGASAFRIAKWDGDAWTPLSIGMDSAVGSLTVFDDGTGPALYAGGRFTTAGVVTVNGIAKWDGGTWSALGSGVGGETSPGSTPNFVGAMSVFDDGSGPALYAGGRFTTAGDVNANRIAKWDGGAWSALGNGMTNSVADLTVFDDGTGTALYVGGGFTVSSTGDSYLARWQGCPAVLCPWDLTGSGSVGAADLAFLLGLWGNPYGSSHLADMLGNWGPCP